MTSQAFSPLSLNQLTRDYWGHYDAVAIAQYAPLASNPCYQPKFYKAPASRDEVMAPGANVKFGMTITPGSIIYGFYLPALLETSQPAQYLVQIRDMAFKRTLWDEAIPSFFLGNYKPTFQGSEFAQFGSFPNLLTAPYPVVGDGRFLFEFWNTSPLTQRIELVLGVFEVVG